jgi:hypothetical protein
MLKNMYALYDKQTNSYLNPIHFINHGEAVRWLTTVVNNKEDKNNNITLYPHHFTLYFLGTYDDQSGKTDNTEMTDVMEASSVVEQISKKEISLSKEISELKEALIKSELIDVTKLSAGGTN